MRNGKILLSTKIIVSQKKLAEGVAVVPCGLEVIYIPPEEMRVDNEPV